MTDKEPRSLRQRVQDNRGRLSPAEERVAAYFVEYPRRAVLASAAELAERLNVSDATVVRAARSLGYSGLGELRSALVAELGSEPTPFERAATTFEALQDYNLSALDMVGRSHIGSIERLLSSTSRPLFEQATNAIATAARTVFFGQGPTKPIAEYGVVQLGRLGGTAAAFTRSGRALADDLLGLRNGDLVVAFVYGQISADASVLFECSRDLEHRSLKLTRL
jgi:DNA-binding MurR/RpiR family transcriptional regulator